MKKKKILVYLLTIICIIAILGGSYAYLRVEKESGNQKIDLVTNFDVILSKDIDELNLNNQVPISDEEGVKGETRSFQIKNESSILAEYKVSLIDNELSTLPNKDVRYKLKKTKSSTNTPEELEIKSLSEDGLIDSGTIEVGETIDYEIVCWIDYNVTEGGKSFSKKILVEGNQPLSLDKSGANPPEMLKNMIPVYYDETSKVWKVADETNRNETYKWYDYDKYMWANAVTVNDTAKKKADITGNNIVEPLYTYTKLDNGDVYFDGVDDYYELGHANYNFQNNISIVLRFNANKLSTTTNNNIIGNPEGGGIFLNVLANKHLEVGIHTGGSNYNFFTSDEAIIEEAKWYTVVVTYDGSKIQMYAYQDENLISKTEKNISGNIKTSPVPFILGANPGPGGFPTDAFTNCTIDLALVYTDVLTDEEITNNFKGEITTYPSDNLLIEAKEFPEQSDLYSKYTSNDDGSLSFDGKDDFYYLGQEKYDFKKSISIVTRFKVNNFLNQSYIIGNAEGAGVCAYILTNKILRIGIHNGSDYIFLDSSKTLEEGKWYTLTATYDGSNMKFYIYQDGKLLEKSEKSLTGSIKPSAAPLILGANPGPSGYPTDSFLNGSISSAFVYTDTLTDIEIEKYFTNEITNYPKDNLLVGYDNFKEKSSREVYLNAKPGTEVKMEDITSMWVWIPRYKYTIFNGNNGTANEQMINVKFEHGIDKTGTVSCHDNILTDDDSASSEECTDTTNGGIVNGKSTYTHPAFTFGDEELVGFWFAKFEMSTDDSACLADENNCNKAGMNIYIKPDKVSIKGISVSNKFANLRSMELANNIHGFPQNEKATSYLDSNGNLSGNIANDDNNYDIHMIKNMEWGAVVFLAQSKYGKIGNPLYEGDYKEIYYNSYREGTDKYIFKTGYSSKDIFGVYNTTGAKYNDLSIIAEGKGYAGAGASTTGTIYGIYDMNGGSGERVMANVVNTSGKTNIDMAVTWNENNLPNEKYYDKYSYNTNTTTKNSFSRGKLGDATKEELKQFDSDGSGWYNGETIFGKSWFYRGTIRTASFTSSNASAALRKDNATSRPVLAISREIPWNKKN